MGKIKSNLTHGGTASTAKKDQKQDQKRNAKGEKKTRSYAKAL